MKFPRLVLVGIVLLGVVVWGALRRKGEPLDLSLWLTPVDAPSLTDTQLFFDPAIPIENRTELERDLSVETLGRGVRLWVHPPSRGVWSVGLNYDVDVWMNELDGQRVRLWMPRGSRPMVYAWRMIGEVEWHHDRGSEPQLLTADAELLVPPLREPGYRATAIRLSVGRAGGIDPNSGQVRWSTCTVWHLRPEDGD